MSTIKSINPTAEDPRATNYTGCSNQEPKLEEKVEWLFSSLLESLKLHFSTSHHPVLIRSDLVDRCLLAFDDFMSVVNAYRVSPDQIKAAKCYKEAGDVYQRSGDIKEAAKCYKEAGDLYQKNGHHGVGAICYTLSADCFLKSGNEKEAAHCYEFTADLYQKNGESKGAAECYSKAADLYRESGDTESFD